MADISTQRLLEDIARSEMPELGLSARENLFPATLDNIDIFDNRDILDRSVEAYEENVPLLAQIAAGFTPPGLAIDAAEAAKYGRDAYRDFSSGELKSGLINTGIAGLSAFGAIPLIGDPVKIFGRRGLKNIATKQVDEIKDLKMKLEDPNIKDTDLLNHPAYTKADEQGRLVTDTSSMEGFGSSDWMKHRPITVINRQGLQETTEGYERATRNLYRRSGEMPWTDAGLRYPAKQIVSQNKKAVIVIGAPASGKSTIANPIARSMNARIIDPDEMAKVLPESFGGIANNATHKEAKLIAKAVLKRSTDVGDNILLPTIGHSPDKIRRMVKELRAKGYEVDLLNVSVTPAEATTRMLNRFAETGKVIPRSYFDEVIDLPDKTYKILKEENIFHGYAKINNNAAINQPKTLIENTTKILDNANIKFRDVSGTGQLRRRFGGGVAQYPTISSNAGEGVQRISGNIDKPLVGGRKEIM